MCSGSLLRAGKSNNSRLIKPFKPTMQKQLTLFLTKKAHSTWARLIAQVYEVDSLVCPRCSAQMRVLAVITEPEEVRKILRYLVKNGRSPPGFDPALLK
jgi:predicted phosphoadenosine phosphosulfate sulfurtransferase